MTQKKSAKKSAAKSTKAPVKAAAKSGSAKSAGASAGQDIVQLILEDHKVLKKLIKVMKDEDSSQKERKEAFTQFWPLLVAHAKPEEQSLYEHIKAQDGSELRMEALEGDVEHGLADQMVEEAKRTTEPELFAARVKVLAELVEHHIKEEEEELLPDFKKEHDIEIRRQLGAMFLDLKDMQRKELQQVKSASYNEARSSH